jgi:hypothetical protein
MQTTMMGVGIGLYGMQSKVMGGSMSNEQTLAKRLRSGRETCGIDACRIRDAKNGCLCAIAADRIEALETALRWYAENCAANGDKIEGPSGDYGQRARAALGEKKP